LDTGSIDEAAKGADALFWLSGVPVNVPNVRAAYNQFAEACAGALKRNPNMRAVHLSSVGAQHPEGTGPILGLHDGEKKVNAAGANVVHLRSNYFMENVLESLPMILSDGAIYSCIPGSAVIEQVATADIAAAAAHYLLEAASGHYVVDVVGPERITYDEIATVVGQVLRKPVKHVQIPPDALKRSAAGGTRSGNREWAGGCSSRRCGMAREDYVRRVRTQGSCAGSYISGGLGSAHRSRRLAAK
jgi:uncharacterized protein YbjT (DUF2867 family)